MRRNAIRWGSGLLLFLLLAVAVTGVVAGRGRAVDRGYELEQRLRCPVCKSVSIAESPSETAQAMRRLVSDQVAAGRTDDQIIDYFRARYGDWVLLDPPMAGSTLALWLVSLGAMALGVTFFVFRRGRSAEPRELSTEERAAVAAELERWRLPDPAREQP